MRVYSFTNFMLSPIQQGIQPGHAWVELFVKYTDESPQKTVLFDWARNGKTAICLNGGNAAGIREIWETIQRLGSALNLPFANFREDEQSLDNTMTSVAIVVPTHIYEGAAELRNPASPGSLFMSTISGSKWSPEEMELMTLLNSYGLAK